MTKCHKVPQSTIRVPSFQLECHQSTNDHSLQSSNPRKDQLVDPAAAKELFEQAASSTKSFETDAFASCEHEIHNEDTPWCLCYGWVSSNCCAVFVKCYFRVPGFERQLCRRGNLICFMHHRAMKCMRPRKDKWVFTPTGTRCCCRVKSKLLPPIAHRR